MTGRMEQAREAAAVDSDDYRHTFYGILNGDGQFWTPLAFDSEKAAGSYLDNWISKDAARFGSMKRTHKIVPVRVQLTALARDTPQGDERCEMIGYSKPCRGSSAESCCL